MPEQVSEEVERRARRARDRGYDPHWLVAHARDYLDEEHNIYCAWLKGPDGQSFIEECSPRSLEEAYQRALAQVADAPGANGDN